MKSIQEIPEQLAQISLNYLHKYNGFPICVVSPNFVYATGGSMNAKRLRVLNSYDERWVIFDGNIKLTEETVNNTYFTFKYLLDNDE